MNTLNNDAMQVKITHVSDFNYHNYPRVTFEVNGVKVVLCGRETAMFSQSDEQLYHYCESLAAEDNADDVYEWFDAQSEQYREQLLKDMAEEHIEMCYDILEHGDDIWQLLSPGHRAFDAFLSKFGDVEEMGDLEQALEEQLDKIAAAEDIKNAVIYRSGVMQYTVMKTKTAHHKMNVDVYDSYQNGVPFVFLWKNDCDTSWEMFDSGSFEQCDRQMRKEMQAAA